MLKIVKVAGFLLISGNGPQLCEGGDFETLNCPPPKTQTEDTNF